jgi:hypothetical protein
MSVGYAADPDNTPPVTTIASGPSGIVNSETATFVLTASEEATFECKLDAGGYASCTSPVALTGLSQGSHTFSVRATDLALNVEVTPKTRTWTVDTVAPDTYITHWPGEFSFTSTAVFVFGSSEPGTFQCRLDGYSWETCASPKYYEWLPDGAHIFQVRAVDLAGNVDPTPADRYWTIRATPPDTIITSGPQGVVNSPTAVFEFTSYSTASFQCKLDSGAFSSCTSPKTYQGLTDGTHTFSVRAIDWYGVLDPTPAVRTWTVQTVPPVAPTLVDPATHFRSSSDFTVSWTKPAGITSFDVRYSKAPTSDGFGDWETWLSATSATGAVFEGEPGATYIFEVRGRSAGGGVSAWSSEKRTAVPLNDTMLLPRGDWTEVERPAAYGGTYSVAWERGARLIRRNVETGHITLYVTKSPYAGRLQVLWNGSILKRVGLWAPEIRHRQLVEVADLDGIYYGDIVIEVISDGRPVRIEGLGVCRD